MNIRPLWVCLTFLWAGAPLTGADPSEALDLSGNWGATIEFGKMRMSLVVKVSRSNDGKLSGKIDIPDQGARDIPVSAMLCNPPDVRWEIDPFDNSAFTGKLSADGQEIVGAFDDGPGGRPIRVTFKRLAKSTTNDAAGSYTFSPGEPRDARGYWAASIAADPGATNHVGLRIGRGADGTFGALLDLLDRGTKDVSASTVRCTNSSVRLEWQLFRIVLDGHLDNSADRIAGTWEERGKSSPVTFERLTRPAQILPDDLSFTPDANLADDLRGEWRGTLEIPDNTKLRIVLRIGQTPQGQLAGTLASPDQGGGEIPLTTGGMTNHQVRLEWKSINGVYKGSLTNNGAVLDGTWEQMGPGLKLRLERAALSSETKNR